jgi:hypothetical protein
MTRQGTEGALVVSHSILTVVEVTIFLVLLKTKHNQSTVLFSTTAEFQLWTFTWIGEKTIQSLAKLTCKPVKI